MKNKFTIASTGGTLEIMVWGGKTDIADVCIESAGGLIATDIVRNRADINRHIKRIEAIVWLTAEQKAEAIQLINSI